MTSKPSLSRGFRLLFRRLLLFLVKLFSGKPLSASSFVLVLCAFAVSAVLGAGLAKATTTPYGMVDPVAPEHATGYRIYLEQCATCHVALPPAVLPTETWQTLVTDSAHYGVALPSIARFDQQLMLNYLQVYSRRNQGRNSVPYRLKDSVYFQALHPNVELPQPLDIRSCAGCHLGAAERNYSGAAEQNYSGAAVPDSNGAAEPD